MSSHKKKKIQISIDPRTPIRIIKEIENNNSDMIVSYGKQYIRESKEYLLNNYPALVEDYEFFKITGDRFDDEFLKTRTYNLLQLQMYENPTIERHLEIKNNKIMIKKEEKTKQKQNANSTKYFPLSE